MLFPSTRQVAHVLLARPPLMLSPKEHHPFDLNVLSTPPAFILSQDQTLYFWYYLNISIFISMLLQPFLELLISSVFVLCFCLIQKLSLAFACANLLSTLYFSTSYRCKFFTVCKVSLLEFSEVYLFHSISLLFYFAS